jgi:hypothetical protein
MSDDVKLVALVPEEIQETQTLDVRVVHRMFTGNSSMANRLPATKSTASLCYVNSGLTLGLRVASHALSAKTD